MTNERLLQQVQLIFNNMSKGKYQHKNNQGFQKGHKDFSTTKSREKISKKLIGHKGYWSGIVGEKNPNWKGGLPKCIDCGKQLKDSYSKRCRKCFSEYNKGKNNPMWRNGVSREYKTGYYSKEYKQWRMAVFQRDNWTCQFCGIRGIYLTAHHTKSFAKYPELRFAIDNGITLCKECHKLTDNYKGRNNKL